MCPISAVNKPLLSTVALTTVTNILFLSLAKFMRLTWRVKIVWVVWDRFDMTEVVVYGSDRDWGGGSEW